MHKSRAKRDEHREKITPDEGEEGVTCKAKKRGGKEGGNNGKKGRKKNLRGKSTNVEIFSRAYSHTRNLFR